MSISEAGTKSSLVTLLVYYSLRICHGIFSALWAAPMLKNDFKKVCYTLNFPVRFPVRFSNKIFSLT